MFGLKTSDINQINACFAACPSIEQVVLYGSRAKGTYRSGSDIDLALVEQGMSYADLLELENGLDDLLLPYKIDLSLKRQINNSSLLAHIERVGQVFYTRAALTVVNKQAENYTRGKAQGDAGK